MKRQKNTDYFYLCQTYTKDLMRNNANMIVIFKQDKMNLRHICMYIMIMLLGICHLINQYIYIYIITH